MTNVERLVRRLRRKFMAELHEELMAGPAGQDYERINMGGCGEFSEWLDAMIEAGQFGAVQLDGKQLAHVRSGEHVWTYYDGRHYDAEAPEGVEDWRELPLWKRRRRLPRPRFKATEERHRLKVSQDCAAHMQRSLLDLFEPAKNPPPL